MKYSFNPAPESAVPPDQNAESDLDAPADISETILRTLQSMDVDGDALLQAITGANASASKFESPQITQELQDSSSAQQNGTATGNAPSNSTQPQFNDNSSAVTHNGDIFTSASLKAASNGSVAPSSTMYSDGSGLHSFSAATREILSRVSAASTIGPGTPEWEAAREKVISDMSLSNHIRGVARGEGKSIANGGTGDLQGSGASSTPGQTPPRGRGRVGRPPGPGRPRGSGRASMTGSTRGATRENARGGRGRGRASNRGWPRRGRGGKRKREDDEDISDDDSDVSDDYTPLATTTKSGRSITKPSTYKPMETDSPTGDAKRRRSHYRRGPEFSTLCTKCQRGHSPPNNAIVFCDGCNLAYHQWCHDPHIPRDVVEVEEKEWVCGRCLHTREMERAKLEDLVSGSALSVEEKTAYFSSLSHRTLVALLQRATALHPDLPVFANPTHNLDATTSSSSTLNPPSTAPFIPTPPTSLNGNSLPLHPPASSIPTSVNTNALPTSTEDDPYPDYAVDPHDPSAPADPPATYPRPGHGPIKITPTTDAEGLQWLVDEDDGFDAFAHLADNGSGALERVGKADGKHGVDGEIGQERHEGDGIGRQSVTEQANADTVAAAVAAAAANMST